MTSPRALFFALALAAVPMGARAQNPDTTRAAPPAADTSRRRQPVTLPSVTLVVPAPPNPWRGYSLRGIGYVGVMTAGLLTMTGRETNPTVKDTGSYKRPKNRPGLAVAAAAGVVALTDAFLTSRRARTRAAQQSPDGSGPRSGLLPPTIDADGRTARIALVRWRF